MIRESGERSYTYFTSAVFCVPVESRSDSIAIHFALPYYHEPN